MFIFVIDTDQYAGNFERDLTAYCTGHIGECGVGDNFAKMYKEDEIGEEFDNIEQVPDDNGCSRPCAIYPTPGYFNDGMGLVYKDDESVDLSKVLENWKNSHIEYKESHRHNYVRWDVEAGKGDNAYVRGLNEEIEEIRNKTVADLHKCPSYQSVAIYFITKPTKKQIQIMKDRSAAFCVNRLCYKKSYNKNNPTINILGYRLLEEKTVTTTIDMEMD